MSRAAKQSLSSSCSAAMLCARCSVFQKPHIVIALLGETRKRRLTQPEHVDKNTCLNQVTFRACLRVFLVVIIMLCFCTEKVLSVLLSARKLYLPKYTEQIWTRQTVDALCKANYTVQETQLKMYQHPQSRLTTNWYSVYTGCARRNVPDFGRVFLMLKYTDITQNTYVQS